jgi:DNA-binding GntR family transcriptional regulator
MARSVTKRQGASSFRPSLHAELTSRLREMILRHELRPDEWVPETELCEDLGISRTPLREALKALAAEKLVILHPNRGATVAGLSVHDVEHLFEVQAIIESAAARLACLRASEAEIDAFEKVHHRMVRFFERGDRKAYFTLNQDLHRSLVEMAHNPALLENHAALMVQIERARFLALDIGHRWQDSVAQHKAVFDALRRRDVNQIEEVVRLHVTETGATVRNAVETRLGNPLATTTGVRRRKTRPAGSVAMPGAD